MSRGKTRIGRAYEDPQDGDGTRVLVDRLWPRGLAKTDAHFDDWAKDVAPSTELRQWYGHEEAKFTEFGRRYRQELSSESGQQALQRLRSHDGRRALTLLTAAKDLQHSQAAVLAKLLDEK